MIERTIDRWRKLMAAHEPNTAEWVALLFCIDQAQRTYRKTNGHYYPNANTGKVTIYRRAA